MQQVWLGRVGTPVPAGWVGRQPRSKLPGGCGLPGWLLRGFSGPLWRPPCVLTGKLCRPQEGRAWRGP